VEEARLRFRETVAALSTRPSAVNVLRYLRASDELELASADSEVEESPGPDGR
jgi:hypothetical protein